MRKVLAATIFCLCGGTAVAQLPTTEALGDRVDAIARQTLSSPAAGMSVAVARDGRVVIARGYVNSTVRRNKLLALFTTTWRTAWHDVSLDIEIGECGCTC
jgi:CubicO group peptidase (beta-lactamase class C family)